MDDNELFLNDNSCLSDDAAELSLDDASPEELDRLWDDADDEFEVCASKKKCDRRKCIIGAVIAAVVIATVGYVIYRCVKSTRKD